jgi:hypothetical protein
MKKIIEHMQKNGKSEDEVNEFKKKIQAWVISLLKPDRFKKLAFYIGKRFPFSKYIQKMYWSIKKE